MGARNLSLDLFAFRTSDEATGKHDGAGGFRLDYPNDTWDVSLNWKQIGDNFNAALGFVPRTGVRITTLGVAFQPRPDRWGIRQFFFEFGARVHHQPEQSRRELAHLHGAVQRADRVGRAPGVEHHPDIRAPRRAFRRSARA